MPMTSTYAPIFVAISVIIVILSAYAALDLAGRVTAAQGRSRIGWLGGGAFAMGTGIWSRHFIGMLAFALPVSIQCHLLTVLASHLAAVLASATALLVVSGPALSWVPLLGGSVLMGTGITTMHYLGMAAMRVDADVSYATELVLLSIVVAMAVSFIGLCLVFRLGDERQEVTGNKLLGAVVIGSVILSMHYTGMGLRPRRRPVRLLLNV